MIQCRDCEFFQEGPNGEIGFSCDPFRNVKEPECLAKWQIIKLNQMVGAYQSQLAFYKKLAPLQEKMFRMVEREMDDMNEADNWKYDDEDDEPWKDDEDAGPLL